MTQDPLTNTVDVDGHMISAGSAACPPLIPLAALMSVKIFFHTAQTTNEIQSNQINNGS